MSVIKAIARDLYKAQQEVSRIEKQMETAPLSEQDALRRQLRQAKKELDALKRILEGEKESAAFRKKFKGFGS